MKKADVKSAKVSSKTVKVSTKSAKRPAGEPAKLKAAVKSKVPVIGVTGQMERLAAAVAAVQAGASTSPRTTRLLQSGIPKMAQKVIEEAGEVAIEAMRADPALIVAESVDLLYNLTVLWRAAGIELGAIWAEMDRREALLGMAEKLPHAPVKPI